MSYLDFIIGKLITTWILKEQSFFWIVKVVIIVEKLIKKNLIINRSCSCSWKLNSEKIAPNYLKLNKAKQETLIILNRRIRYLNKNKTA
jgi:hypothetical protein